jgi:hypothetical protein
MKEEAQAKPMISLLLLKREAKNCDVPIFGWKNKQCDDFFLQLKKFSSTYQLRATEIFLSESPQHRE